MNFDGRRIEYIYIGHCIPGLQMGWERKINESHPMGSDLYSISRSQLFSHPMHITAVISFPSNGNFAH
jgi:hypothetical protein